jgi:Signal transduction histidine kinase
VFTVVNDARGVQVMVGDNMQMRDHLVNDVMMGTLLPMALFLPLGALLIWFSVRRGLGPLHAMAETLGRRHDSDLRPLGVNPMPTELRPVLNAINGLFSRVATARDREKSFTAFAAHELKTPLAGLKTQAQIALMTTDDEMRSRALAQIAGSVDRCARMVRQLLDLAAADAASAEGDGHADVAKVLEDAVMAVSPLAVHKDSRIVVTGAMAGTISCDRALATTAVRNLLENAVVHSPAGSNVHLHVSSESGPVIISVSDDGPGMTEEEVRSSTDRFVRGRTSSGSGLGLAIVDAVAKRSSGSLSVANGPEGGLTVTLTLLSQGQESPKGESCRRL